MKGVEERVRRWASSPEGTAEIRKALADVKRMVERLQQDRRVPLEMLDRPMDI